MASGVSHRDVEYFLAALDQFQMLADGSIGQVELAAARFLILLGKHCSLHRQDLADLVNAYFGFALGDVIGDGAAVDQYRLGVDLLGDAEPLQKLADINSARAAGRRIDIGHRFCRQQRAPPLMTLMLAAASDMTANIISRGAARKVALATAAQAC